MAIPRPRAKCRSGAPPPPRRRQDRDCLDLQLQSLSTRRHRDQCAIGAARGLLSAERGGELRYSCCTRASLRRHRPRLLGRGERSRAIRSSVKLGRVRQGCAWTTRVGRTAGPRRAFRMARFAHVPYRDEGISPRLTSRVNPVATRWAPWRSRQRVLATASPAHPRW
jgi:hypothetical protein